MLTAYLYARMDRRVLSQHKQGLDLLIMSVDSVSTTAFTSTQLLEMNDATNSTKFHCDLRLMNH